MKKYLYILIGLAAAFSTYYIYKSNTEAPQDSEVSQTTDEGLQTTELDESKTPDSPAPVAEKRPELRPNEIFSDSASGKSIAKIIDMYQDLDAPDSPSGKEAHAELQKLYDTPNQAFEEIKKGAMLLPQSMELQRQFLLQFSSLLNVERTDKLNFLDKSFKSSIRTAASSVNFQTRNTPVIAFETYCKVANDKGLCFDLLNGSIDSAPKDVQIPLLNAYKKVDMDGARELAKKLDINTY